MVLAFFWWDELSREQLARRPCLRTFFPPYHATIPSGTLDLGNDNDGTKELKLKISTPHQCPKRSEILYFGPGFELSRLGTFNVSGKLLYYQEIRKTLSYKLPF